jgi:DNA-binding IclR family transcriptional regulator
MSALETAVSVLRCYSSTRTELTVTEVAQMLSLPKSNVSRLLRSMRDVGLLDSARDGRGYSPGVMLLGFGEVASAGRSLGMRAHAAVTRLSEMSGHAGFVSARVGQYMVGLTHHAGRNPLQVGVFLGGQRLHVDACATGRALLATMSDDAVRELLGGQVSRATAQAPAIPWTSCSSVSRWCARAGTPNPTTKPGAVWVRWRWPCVTNARPKY